jgi:hypothetical protein
MKRLTTDDAQSILYGLNLIFVKDGEVWIRGGGPAPDYPDCTLVEYIGRIAETHHLDIVSRDAESLGDEMYDCLQYGVEELEGVVAFLHTAAIQAAEKRGRLSDIEDILGGDYDLDKLRDLVDADRVKRCFALPVLPALSPGLSSSAVFILLDSGEIDEDTVGNILIAPYDSGDIHMMFDTFNNGYFDDDDVGKRIFWRIEDAQKAAAALKGGQDA